jgi:tetratricopeptide (TPR) repeat protein
MADRYTYLPLTGIFVMFVWGITDLLARSNYRMPVAVATAAAVLACALTATRFQLKYWRDSETLFTRDLALFPHSNPMAHHCLGRALFEKGDDRAALAHYEEVLRLIPDFVPGHLNIANCLSRLGRFDEATAHYQEAIRLRPDNAELYKSFGSHLMAQMKLEEAKANFLEALRYEPNFPEAHTKLGTLLMVQGKTDEAIKHFNASVQIFPGDREGHYYLANALIDNREFAEAARHFQFAIKADPNYAEALNDLAWMWVTEKNSQPGHTEEAIALARRAVELSHHTNVTYLETLAAALSQGGQFADAVAAAEKAVTTAAAQGQRQDLARLQAQVTRYRAGQGYTAADAPQK